MSSELQLDRKERPQTLLRGWIRGMDRWFFAQRFAKNKGAVIGLVVLCLAVLIALLADFLAPYDPMALGSPFLPPGQPHWLGTDDLGRDILSGVIYGSRTSLVVGVLAAVLSLIVGVIVGSISGYYGGKLGDLLDRVTEMFMVVPQFFLALLIVAFFGSDVKGVIFVIGILSWPPIARLVRAQFLWLKELGFVEAARSLGMNSITIIMGEIMPNAIPPAIVNGSLQIGRAILLEASLSFLGMGDPSVVSWGTMLHTAQPFLRNGWWMALFPGIGIAVIVLAVNLAGDGLNDALNPRSQER